MPGSLLQRVLSHFTPDESPSVRTRIWCVVGPLSTLGRRSISASHLPEGPRGWGRRAVVNHCVVRTPADLYAVEGIAACRRRAVVRPEHCDLTDLCPLLPARASPPR